jgi:hypothetical protein
VGVPAFFIPLPDRCMFYGCWMKNTPYMPGARKKLPAGTKYALYVPGITTAGTYTWRNMPNCRKKLPVGTNRPLYVPTGTAVGTNVW